MPTQLTDIPKWNSAGILPPTLSGSSDLRSPYSTDSLQLVHRFSGTHERRRILSGFFDYRAALNQAGILSGFQWLNGSFLEQVEVLERRAPRDIDVVSFLDLQNINQKELLSTHGDLFNQEYVKQQYLVDAYIVQIGLPLDKHSANRISYWYSMWSHRRNGLWKGFLQIDLDLCRDEQARELLQQVEVSL